MKVYLARVASTGEYSSVPAVSGQLASQRQHRHSEVSNPEDADVVLFPDCHVLGPRDWALRAIRASEIAQQFREKVCVYNERDRPWCCLPGIYVSMPKSGFIPRWQVAGAYLGIEPPAERLGGEPGAVEPDLLFSFVGATTHRCREEILQLRHARSYAENTDGFLFHDASSRRFDEKRRRFAESILRSKFVLCPRGHAVATFRMFETMAAGRVPVIVADAWVPPAGPVWEELSIRWPEGRIAELPRQLEEREDEAAAMGVRAREAFERWFARDVVLAHQLDQLERLMDGGDFATFPVRGCRNQQYLRTLRGAVTARARGLRWPGAAGGT